MGWLQEAMGHLSLEFLVRNKAISELTAELEVSGKEIIQRISHAQVGSEVNQAKMRHIIGIERWGQSRLRGFLGGTPVDDEYDDYCPDIGPDLAELIELFKEARTKNVHLGIQIESLFVNAAKEAQVSKPLDDIAEYDEELSDEEGREERSSPEKNSPEKRAIVYTVNHNEFGPLSPRGWLRYLELHARMESKSIK